jgi:hypothetical protein
MTVEACVGGELGLNAMRYRKEFGIRQLAGTFAAGLAIGFIVSLRYTPRSLLNCLRFGLTYTLLSCLFYFFRYWETRNDCLIYRFFFRRIVFPFSNIAYVGPMKGEASNHKFFGRTVLVETVDGKRMYVEPADPAAFLADMRTHLPAITLQL